MIDGLPDLVSAIQPRTESNPHKQAGALAGLTRPEPECIKLLPVLAKEHPPVTVLSGMAAKSSNQPSLQLRFRLLLGSEIALGPGKAELLRWVRETGSISEAAREMRMSYMRAWSLVQTMNRCFREPVITTERGGKERGGSKLTKTGEKILALYEQLQEDCNRTSRRTLTEMTRLLRDKG